MARTNIATKPYDTADYLDTPEAVAAYLDNYSSAIWPLGLVAWRESRPACTQ